MFGIPMRHLARYQEILSIIIRHGLGYFLNPTHGQVENLERIGVHLREAFTELGPTFVKLGQLASSRSDIFPQPIVQELAKLQDRVRPMPFESVRQVIEISLQTSLDSVFSEFRPRPLAAASLGQVHLAVLKSGERVVVKVQRPHLREVVETDLEIFKTVITQVEQRTEWGERYPLQMLLKEYSKTLLEELDFLREGRNAEKLAYPKRRRKNLLIPKIYWEFSRPSILILEYIQGVTLSQIIDRQKQGQEISFYNPHQIAVQLSQVLLEQILQEGYFHGDPHPGNILITSEGKITLIDFGSMGTLTPEKRSQLISLITGFLGGNDKKILRTIEEMGIIPRQFDRYSLHTDLSALRVKHLQAFSKRRGIGEAYQDFFNLVNRYGVIIPSEFFLVGKSLLILEGILNTLDPAFSYVELTRPFTLNFVLEKFNPKKLLDKIRLRL